MKDMQRLALRILRVPGEQCHRVSSLILLIKCGRVGVFTATRGLKVIAPPTAYQWVVHCVTLRLQSDCFGSWWVVPYRLCPRPPQPPVRDCGVGTPMASCEPPLPESVAEWTRCDVRRWLEARLATRFPGQCFDDALTRVELLHLIDGRLLLELQDSDWQEAIPSIGARKVLMRAARQLAPVPRTEPGPLPRPHEDVPQCPDGDLICDPGPPERDPTPPLLYADPSLSVCPSFADSTASVRLRMSSGDRDEALGARQCSRPPSGRISPNPRLAPVVPQSDPPLATVPSARRKVSLEPPSEFDVATFIEMRSLGRGASLSRSSSPGGEAPRGTGATPPAETSECDTEVHTAPSQGKPRTFAGRCRRLSATAHLASKSTSGLLRTKRNAAGRDQSMIWQPRKRAAQVAEEAATVARLLATSRFSKLPIVDCDYHRHYAALGPAWHQRLRCFCTYWASKSLYYGRCLWRLLDRWQLVWCALCCVAVGLCARLGVTAPLPSGLWVNVLLFPLAFAVNSAFGRREGALANSADFKACCLTLYLSHRCWHFERDIPHDFLRCSSACFTRLFEHVRGYLTARTEDQKRVQLRHVYDGLSELSLVNDVLRISGVPAPLVGSLTSTCREVVRSFERLRTFSDYRTPSSIRVFMQLCIVLVPLLLVPGFAHLATEYHSGAVYVAGFLLPFPVMLLQSVQKRLENPFSHDDNPDGIQLDGMQMVEYMADGELIAGPPRARPAGARGWVDLTQEVVVGEEGPAMGLPGRMQGPSQ